MVRKSLLSLTKSGVEKKTRKWTRTATRYPMIRKKSADSELVFPNRVTAEIVLAYKLRKRC